MWNGGADIVLQVRKAREITAELNGVAADNLGGHIFVGIGPLVVDAANIRPKRL